MNNEQIEEYESLKEVFKYNDLINFNKIDQNHYRVHICFSSSCSLILFYYLPNNYPFEEIPRFEAKTKRNWLNDGQLNVCIDEAERIANEYRGGQCIYAIVDYLQSEEFLQKINAKIYKDDEAEKEIQAKQEIISKEENEESVMQGLSAKGIPIFISNPINDRKSKFIAFAAPVNNEKEVRIVFEELLRNKKISIATHNIQAYRIKINDSIICDFDDDGEHAAGKQLLKSLEQISATNVCVMVSRWFGGILLGPDRFKDIITAAQDAINIMNTSLQTISTTKVKKN
ncbi:impact, putative [Entamoeba dispar SAW760]|uniref:Impact, putative n=1 Tax=Entamoeba dispar (strain ATCC PRA-260 / SAW760) TaxID=370354 RepID=B0E6K3_ENTDS|nr:impact, putative [Entamoeba dispar SAW760]EDR29836.1 impact, putative [Entamoeba dispar SAW760]|eukprot:EDR29836.1 impact, putative [Entamoeba dispar SAW760]